MTVQQHTVHHSTVITQDQQDHKIANNWKKKFLRADKIPTEVHIVQYLNNKFTSWWFIGSWRNLGTLTSLRLYLMLVRKFSAGSIEGEQNRKINKCLMPWHCVICSNKCTLWFIINHLCCLFCTHWNYLLELFNSIFNSNVVKVATSHFNPFQVCTDKIWHGIIGIVVSSNSFHDCIVAMIALNSRQFTHWCYFLQIFINIWPICETSDNGFHVMLPVCSLCSLSKFFSPKNIWNNYWMFPFQRLLSVWQFKYSIEE